MIKAKVFFIVLPFLLTSCYYQSKLTNTTLFSSKKAPEDIKLSILHPYTVSGFIITAYVPMYKADRIMVYRDSVKLWEVEPKKKSRSILTTKYGEVPHDYVQTYPLDRKEPECLIENEMYEIICEYTTKKKNKETFTISKEFRVNKKKND